MANRYTYDDFQKAMQSSGLGGQFSDADLKLAQQNPDAGMSILKYKQDYKNAATDEARALANLGAEGIRSSYGGYTGGQRGANFYLDPLSPNDFQSSAAPTYKTTMPTPSAAFWTSSWATAAIPTARRSRNTTTATTRPFRTCLTRS